MAEFPSTLILPEHPDVTFPGFSQAAFDLLESLRNHPHIEQYRKIKPELDRHLIQPFKQYRDDLAVNYVLPNRLPLETERNVFSRLLKNDFGAGGCHHHLWMAFYQPDRTRIKDLQLAHSISPDGLAIGIHAGQHAPQVFDRALSAIYENPTEFMGRINRLLEKEGWQLNYDIGTGRNVEEHFVSEPLTALPEDLRRVSSIWIYTEFQPVQVVTWGGGLVVHALQAVQSLWPAYRFLS